MKMTWLHYLAVGLLAVIVCLLLFWPKGEPSKVITKANDSIETINEQNRILAMSVRTLELNLQHTKNWAKIDSARFVTEITVKNQQLAKKRVVVQHIIDTIPELKDFVATADNVIELQRQRIDTLEQALKFQEGLYSQMIYIQNKRIQNLEIVATQKDLIIGDQEKTIKKSRRGKKVLKVLAVTGAVGGLLLGSQF